MNTLRTSQLRESVQCAICLETLKSPRALVCLHTFCEECIQGLVNGIASTRIIKGIPCPVCREDTPPPGRGLPPSDWAKHLRRNTVILPLIESLNTVPTSDLTREVARTSDSAPNSFTATSGHPLARAAEGDTRQTVPESRADTSTILERCARHPSVPVQYFCRDHTALLCVKCRKEHRRCPDVVVLSPGEMKTSIAQAKTDIRRAFQHSLGELTKVKDALEVNKINTVREIEHFPRRVRELQAMLNRNIDQLCETLERDSGTFKEEHTKLQTNQIADCSSLEAGIKAYNADMNFILQHRNVFQQFQACESIKAQIGNVENAVAAARSSMQFGKVRLSAVQVLESLIRLQDDFNKVEHRTYKPDF